MADPITGMVTTVVGGVRLALDNMGNQYAPPLLKPPANSASQTWIYYPDSQQLQATSFPSVNNGWVGLRSDNLLIDLEWNNDTMYWGFSGGNLKSVSTNEYLVPTSDGTSVMLTATLGAPWTLGDTQVGPTGLQAIPVAMFAPQNPNSTDPVKATGSWEYWGNQLQKTGPVITMPLAVGVEPNYGGDAFAWVDPTSIMVQDTNPAWMLSVGLNMPQGPTLTEAAASGLALYDPGAPMDLNWANAAGARYGQYYGNPNGTGPGSDYTPSHQRQVRDVLYIRPGWEMTLGQYTWAMDAPGQVSTWAADFKAAFRRCVEVFREVCSRPDVNGKTTKVVAIFNPNGNYWVPAAINLDDFYPGDDIVDCMAIDIYDQPEFQGGYQADGVTPNLSPIDRFNQFVLPNLQAIDAYAHAHGKSVGVCEWAAGAGGGDNPTYIDQMAAWVGSAQSEVAVMGYWSGGPDSGYDGDITEYPQQEARFIANFGT